METYGDEIRRRIGNENVILYGETALTYTGMFAGYLHYHTLEVYALEKGNAEDVIYHIVKNFDDIKTEEKCGIKYSTFEQSINDLFNDYENADSEVILQSLAEYFIANSYSYKGLSIRKENTSTFLKMAEMAKDYYRCD